MVQLLETDFHEDAFILLGDFNDAPDDRSLNILETGDPNATAGPEEIAGPFLVNLMEPLYAQGHPCAWTTWTPSWRTWRRSAPGP